MSLCRQSVAPSVVGSLKDGDDKGKSKAKPPIVIWPEWSDQDINQEKWVMYYLIRFQFLNFVKYDAAR